PPLLAALKTYGVVVGQTPVAEVEAKIRQRSAAVQSSLRALLGHCLAVAPAAADKERQWLLEVLARQDPDPWRLLLRRALGAKDSAGVERLLGQKEFGRQHPAYLLALVKLLPDDARGLSLVLVRRVRQQFPDDFWANFDLAEALANSVL